MNLVQGIKVVNQVNINKVIIAKINHRENAKDTIIFNDAFIKDGAKILEDAMNNGVFIDVVKVENGYLIAIQAPSKEV